MDARLTATIAHRNSQADHAVKVASCVEQGNMSCAVSEVGEIAANQAVKQGVDKFVKESINPVARLTVGVVGDAVDTYQSARAGDTTDAVLYGVKGTLNAACGTMAITTAADSWNPTVVAPAAATAVTCATATVFGLAKTGHDIWKSRQTPPENNSNATSTKTPPIAPLALPKQSSRPNHAALRQEDGIADRSNAPPLFPTTSATPQHQSITSPFTGASNTAAHGVVQVECPNKNMELVSINPTTKKPDTAPCNGRSYRLAAPKF